MLLQELIMCVGLMGANVEKAVIFNLQALKNTLFFNAFCKSIGEINTDCDLISGDDNHPALIGAAGFCGA